MGHKVNPKSMRLKINEVWQSKWFGGNNYAEKLIEDLKIRRTLEKRLKDAGVTKIDIIRDSNKITVDIHSSRPGLVIGRGGSGSDELKKLLSVFVSGKIQINIIEAKKPDADATIIAQNVASQIEKRIPYRRAIKQVMEKAKTAGATGLKIQISGRLNGAEIARSEKMGFGTVPLSTFKSDIDYKYHTALTTYGIVGIKVWVYKGERSLESEDFNGRQK
ncbi:MAG TPA: 30S ribosomal protein S3 [bacterium]|nr:30S ribosomal protein S3 [bacterium]